MPSTPATADRPIKPAILRGLMRRCPNCGQGAMFDGYLTVTHDCASCGQPLHHHRADDGPAYLTILVVGHIMGLLIHLIWVHLRPEPWVMAVTLCALATVLSLALLPRLKGMVVAIQWAKRMHGFGAAA